MRHQAVFIFVGVLFVLLFNLEQPANCAPVEYSRRWVGRVTVNVVQVDLNSPNVEITPVLAQGHVEKGKTIKAKQYKLEQFASLIHRTHPVVAINGTYHDTKTGRIIGTIVINNKVVTVGERGAAVCFDKKNRMSVHLVSGRNGNNLGWSTFKSAISTGPTLIRHGQVWLKPRKEYFKDPDVYAHAKRSAMALTNSNKLLLVTIEQKVSLKELANTLLVLGAEEAVALDGGSSSALYYRGRVITKPSRPLANFLLVYERPTPATLAKGKEEED